MKSSLAEQLRKLAAPQTSILIESKKRPSIIFDENEAATKDRKTIFDLGYSGLMELVAVNQSFIQFEQTLFQSSTIHMERSVESSKVNDQLNANIKKFMYHLSPYFMLRSSHLCLEWLIRRFHIHEFNREELLALIFPYHETKIFVRCVQLLNLKNPNDQWKWLQPIQKPGVAVSKMAILNRAANDIYFLKFICQATENAIKELGTKAQTLQTQLNFYCMLLVGAMESAKNISEGHISTMLPSILKGLSSNVIDFVAAAFIITSQLVAKAKLTEKVLNVLIEKICVVSFDSMQADKILLLMTIIKTQWECDVSFSADLLLNIISIKGITKTLGSLSSQSIPVVSLGMPLAVGCIKQLQSCGANSNDAKSFLEKLLSEIHWSSDEATSIIRIIITKYAGKSKLNNATASQDVIVLDSDNEETSEDFQAWYSMYVQSWERRYPSEFDAALKSVMQDEGNSVAEQQALKIILSFRLQSFKNEPNTSVYENLYHHNARIRAEAVKFVVTNFEELSSSQNIDLIKESLSDRLKDDKAIVVTEVLKLSTKDLINISSDTSLCDTLISIIGKMQKDPETWSVAMPAVLTHLTKQDTFGKQKSEKILLALMPFIFPIEPTQASLELIQIIVKSEIHKILPFVKNLKSSFNNINGFNKKAEEAITSSKGSPKINDIITYLENDASIGDSSPSSFEYILLLITLCFKENTSSDTSLKVLYLVQKYMDKYQLEFVAEKAVLSSLKERKASLKLFINFLTTLVAKTDMQFNINLLCATPISNEFLFKTFELLVTKAFTANSAEKAEYAKALKMLMDTVFSSTSEKLKFLSIFFSHARIFNDNVSTETRIRALKLFNVSINKMKSDVKISTDIFINALISLVSPTLIIRECAIETFKLFAVHGIALESEQLRQLALVVVEKSEEIIMDCEQFPLILFTHINSKKKTRQSDLSSSLILSEIVNILCDNSPDAFLAAKLLSLIKHINGKTLFKRLLDLGLKTLDEIKDEDGFSLLDIPHSDIFEHIIQRVDNNILPLLNEDPKCWVFLSKALQFNKCLIVIDGKLLPIASLIIEQFDEDLYSQLPTKYKEEFLKLVTNAITSSGNRNLFVCANKMLKRCVIDSKNLLQTLNGMSKKSGGSQKARGQYSLEELNCNDWKDGITLLELLENAKKIDNSVLLIPVLFDILQKCLSFEEQVPVEYPKQLVLSSILNCCKKLDTTSKMNESVFRIDMIVQCVRGTQNPQTHHHALLLLSQCARIFPQQVLHNIMDIFTFMGSSVMRHDDSFSFQIISNIMESVIPTLVQHGSKDHNESMVIPVFKVFADIILDVPEHRRLPLYIKLLTTLDSDKYLWMFVCVVFDSHVMHEGKSKTTKTTKDRVSDMPRRTEICLQLAKAFSPQIMVNSCISLLEYLKSLPNSIVAESKTKPDLSSIDSKLFDLETRTSKQLRHFKYVILQFISTLTSSTEFVNSIAVLDTEQTKCMKVYYQNFIIKILSYIPMVLAAIEREPESSQVKFWKIICHHCYDILENAVSLLTPDMFLAVVQGLMQHQMVAVRKKVLELLINKLQHKCNYFDQCSEENLSALLPPLTDIVETISEKDKSTNISVIDISYMQQSALIGLKLLSKHIGLKYIDHFKNVLNKLIYILKKRDGISKIIFATVIVSTVEICSNLKAHSISLLPKIMPHIIQVLQEQSEAAKTQQPHNVCIAVITGVQKLLEALPLFLGPYILDIVSSLSTLWVRIENTDQKSSNIVNKLYQIWARIATEIPSRILVPNFTKAYGKLIETENYNAVNILMNLLVECLNSSAKFDMNAVHNELTEFFLRTLEFRSHLNAYHDQTFVNEVEEKIIDTVVVWILKLSESSFRPLYHKIYDLCVRERMASNKERVITYFVLSSKIAESLKSLFVLFASDFVQDAANLLNLCNASKTDDLYFKDVTEKNSLLIKYILKTLKQVFLHDNSRFINPHRFDILMQPIVDQLENVLVADESITSELLGCISQLAVAVTNDVLWKQLNYQVLMKTRSNKPEVRIVAFNSCVDIAKKLGEDFTPLLPETVPFIAELLEDENSIVESNCRKGVQEMEKVLGESLQKYL